MNNVDLIGIMISYWQLGAVFIGVVLMKSKGISW